MHLANIKVFRISCVRDTGELSWYNGTRATDSLWNAYLSKLRICVNVYMYVCTEYILPDQQRERSWNSITAQSSDSTPAARKIRVAAVCYK